MPVELQHQSEISSEPCSLSFQDLAGALAGQQSIPGLPVLYELIERAGLAVEIERRARGDNEIAGVGSAQRSADIEFHGAMVYNEG